MPIKSIGFLEAMGVSTLSLAEEGETAIDNQQSSPEGLLFTIIIHHHHSPSSFNIIIHHHHSSSSFNIHHPTSKVYK